MRYLKPSLIYTSTWMITRFPDFEKPRVKLNSMYLIVFFLNLLVVRFDILILIPSLTF